MREIDYREKRKLVARLSASLPRCLAIVWWVLKTSSNGNQIMSDEVCMIENLWEVRIKWTQIPFLRSRNKKIAFRNSRTRYLITHS